MPRSGARTIPDAPGLDAIEMIEAADDGQLEALYVVGWDVLLTQPNTNVTGRGLATLDSVVVQDLFLNETARTVGTVFLPAAAAFEKDGTFMSSERRIQRVRTAVTPPGEALPDWQIVCAVANALGSGASFQYGTVDEVWNEIRRVWPAGAGVSYRVLDEPGGSSGLAPTMTIPARQGCISAASPPTTGVPACAACRTSRHQIRCLMTSHSTS